MVQAQEIQTGSALIAYIVATVGISGIFGAGVAWGIHRSTVASLRRDIQTNKGKIDALASADESLETKLDIVNRELTRIDVILTGATGSNGLVGEMRTMRKQIEQVSSLLQGIAAKLDIQMRRET